MLALERDPKLTCTLCWMLHTCHITGHPGTGSQHLRRSLQQQNNSNIETPAVGGGSAVGAPAPPQPPTDPGTAVGGGSAVNNPGPPASGTNPDIAVGPGAAANDRLQSPAPTGLRSSAGSLTQLPWLVSCWALAVLVAGWAL